METMVYKTEPESELHRAVQAAGELLRAGKLVAIPTETVYGLAANALDPEAVNNIFKAKGRPNDNPPHRTHRRPVGAARCGIGGSGEGPGADGAFLAWPADHCSAPESADPR